jgi:hypothetical protein
MNDDFKPYTKGRLIKKVNDFFIIKPDNEYHSTPISCPNCHLLMRSKEDELAWDKFQCCNICSMEWAESQKENWKNGWRPSPEEISKKLQSRIYLSINFND